MRNSQSEFAIGQERHASAFGLAPARKVAGLDEGVRSGERAGDGVLDGLFAVRLGLGEEVVLVARKLN